MSIPVPAAVPTGPAAILIVGDAPAQPDALRAAMVEQGYRTFVADSGERALDIAQTARPDLILLEAALPDLDGLEVCRRLKAHPLTCEIPVMLMGTDAGAEQVVEAFDIGAADFLARPLRLAELCARVRSQLRLRATSLARQEQLERLRLVVASMDEGLMLVEPDRRIQYANPACERYLGYAPGALAGRSLADLLPASMAQDPLARLGPRDVQVRRRDGTTRPMDLTLSPLGEGQSSFIVLLHDITHHKQSEDALQRAALVDPLTRIANRRHFDNFFEKEWQRSVRSRQPLSLIVLDVDHFKGYNDSLGHAAGDVCLQQVAMALQSHALRATDIAARYGGEEFVLVFGETGFEAACSLAEAIRYHIESLRIPNPRSTTSPWVTASLGVSTIVPTPLDDIKEFFIGADRAMYAVKQAGRNGVRAVNRGSERDAVAVPA